MLLILISWIYIFFTSINFGNLLLRILKCKSNYVVLTSIIGLFFITILASIWAVFGRINIEFHICILILNGAIFYTSKKNILSLYKELYNDFTFLSKPLKWMFLFNVLLILIQSSTSPILTDNETYYIQTIKWLNEYGFVPGLANLHLFLGQTSGWHITQSVFNFSFLYSNFNDINGFALVITSFFFLKRLQIYFESKSNIDLLFGLFPLLFIVLFPFINAPSPDVMVYLLSFLVFYLFLKEATLNFTTILLLALFAFYIKITAAILLIIPFLILLANFSKVKSTLFKSGIISCIVFFLWTVKNIIITGYPFFPISKFTLFEVKHAIPKPILDYFFSKELMHSFYIFHGKFENNSMLDILKSYFLYNGIDSVFAIITFLLVLISPFVLIRLKNYKLWVIYSLFIAQLLLLSFSSPQFRFYFFFTLFFGLLLISSVLKNKKFIFLAVYVNLFLILFIYFIPNSFHYQSLENLTISNSIFPNSNSSTVVEYKAISNENLHYNSPLNDSLFWITGNGLLPCVSQSQIEYFQTNFNVVPQLNGATLKDGFYSKKINP